MAGVYVTLFAIIVGVSMFCTQNKYSTKSRYYRVACTYSKRCDTHAYELSNLGPVSYDLFFLFFLMLALRERGERLVRHMSSRQKLIFQVKDIIDEGEEVIMAVDPFLAIKNQCKHRRLAVEKERKKKLLC